MLPPAVLFLQPYAASSTLLPPDSSFILPTPTPRNFVSPPFTHFSSLNLHGIKKSIQHPLNVVGRRYGSLGTKKIVHSPNQATATVDCCIHKVPQKKGKSLHNVVFLNLLRVDVNPPPFRLSINKGQHSTFATDRHMQLILFFTSLRFSAAALSCIHSLTHSFIHFSIYQTPPLPLRCCCCCCLDISDNWSWGVDRTRMK